ncbi:uncharacterized protein LOC126667054 [Mercurialis annua]|uniref:uncharacterized protein LOC126667054 n=1 Tax=Mercurialis annua TaxID=3986 RepID=UPI00215EC71F|nr:uncharacterized protein LOC126667054 [Mercurialis annua]
MARNVFCQAFQLLELNVISGQDLAPVSRKMRTYAIAWVHPDRKLSTRVDTQGHNNPTWNDKFVFRVDDEFLYGETSAIMIEIYASNWFKDIHVGTIRVLVGNLAPPQKQPRQQQQHHVQLDTMRFVALQVRRRSGRPQGILNIGVAILDTSMRSMPLYSQISASAVGYRDLMGGKEKPINNNYNHNNKDDDRSSDDNQNQFLLPWIPKPDLRRTKSDSSSMVGSEMVENTTIQNKKQKKGGSMISGSEIIKKENINGYKSFKKQSSMASSMILTSEIIQKLTKKPVPLNPDSTVGGLTKSKYGSESNSGDTPPPTRKSPVKTALSSLTSFKFGTPKPTNRAKTPHHVTESELGLGPSASEVAAMMIRNNKHPIEETESEIMGSWSLESTMEGLQSKLERWRAELPPVYDRSELSSYPMSSVAVDRKREISHARRRSSGGDGAFTCFGTFCGLECSIVCGGNGPGNKKNMGRVKRVPSTGNLSLL